MTFWLIAGSILSAVVHNFLYGVFGVEEPILFFSTLILFLGFLVSVAYDIFTYKTKGKPEDLWRLGWFLTLGIIRNPARI